MMAWLNRATGRWLCWTGAHHYTRREFGWLRPWDGVFTARNARCCRCGKEAWVNWPAKSEEVSS